MRNKNAKFPDPNKYVTDPGSDVQILYDPKINKDGTISLVENGKESISQYINSFKEQTDISYILKRLELGDTSVLSQAQAMYGDFSEMPKTLAEVLQLKIDAEHTFDRLPVETKQKFNNNFNQWFSSLGTEEWQKKMIIEKGDIASSVEQQEAGEPLVGSGNV